MRRMPAVKVSAKGNPKSKSNKTTFIAMTSLPKEMGTCFSIIIDLKFFLDKNFENSASIITHKTIPRLIMRVA